ncbi:hypothetical protein HXX76_011037 [Chlamydomonas incerta]|uniref:Uncharacterized protein n=1 Tax=Chlamydomonas incerta TaxID=51695 RepID=A0A835VXA1_CHLIN|nr:hypothetical protein HXX76_011037 [Chlamydomonas incerta]|eukprot:KAG2429268.1 hypothetical protein HXX76_011037 [Chlamydomonas incerta]
MPNPHAQQQQQQQHQQLQPQPMHEQSPYVGGGNAGLQPPPERQAGRFARFFKRQPTAAQAAQNAAPQPQYHKQQPDAASLGQAPPVAAGHVAGDPAQQAGQPAPQYLANMLTPGNSAARPLTVTGNSVPQPSRTRFALFQGRNGPSPTPKPAPLPQQPPALAFPPPRGTGWTAPLRAGATASSTPRDTQEVQELVGGNWIFLIFVPYFVATALQDTHLRIGLIVATATSVGVLLLGLLAFIMNLRKVFPHVLELLMLVMYAVLLGVSYSSQAAEAEIVRTYDFIVHSALAGTCLLSLLVCYPLGQQHVAELVHSLYMGHPDVHTVGMYTTAGLTAAFVSSCLLYLIPLCKGRDDEHWDVLNLIFRIIYPCVCTALALLYARYLPDALLPNLAVVHGLNRRPPARLPAYLTDLLGLRPPAILDPTMYQSTSDAAAKVREGWALASRSAQASPARTPRYGPGSAGGAPAPPPYPYQASPLGSAYAPLGSSPVGPADGLVMEPGHPGYGGAYGGGSGHDAAGQQPYDPSRAYPRQRPELHGPKYLTYLAPGPPAPPPAAVFAVYDGHPSYSHSHGHGHGHGHSQSAGGAGDGRMHAAMANPLMAAAPGPGYGMHGAVYPAYPAGLYGPKPYGGQGRLAAALSNFRGRMGAGPGAGMGADVYPYDPNSAPHAGVRGRPFASAGGAGPYGVNQLAELEAGMDPHQPYGQSYMPPGPTQHARMYARAPDREPLQPPLHPLQPEPLRPLGPSARPRYASEGGRDRGFGQPGGGLGPTGGGYGPTGGGYGPTGGGYGLAAESAQPELGLGPAYGQRLPRQWPETQEHGSTGPDGGGYGLGAEINKAADPYDLPPPPPPLGPATHFKPRLSVAPPASVLPAPGFGLDAETDEIPSPAGLPPVGAGFTGGLAPLPQQRLGPSRLGPSQLAPATRPRAPASGRAPARAASGGGGAGGFGLDVEVEAEVNGAGAGSGMGPLGSLARLPQPSGRRHTASPLPPRPASNALGAAADAFGLDAEVGM